MAKAKEHMNLAFIGHVDHGKSTLVLWTSSKKKEKEGLQSI